jgi:autophagy-related protein 9
MSYPFASRYLDQFPKVKMVQVARFVAFVAGAIVAVLAVATLWDSELFLAFEVTSERTVFFYLALFGAIWTISNGTIPDENLVFDPEYALRNVIEYTHYCPNHWHGRLHSDEVRKEFAFLYQLKIAIFFEEVFSIIITPFVLWFSLPKCSDQIIDFFREFTIHVDGVGYLCSFAVFDFKKGVSGAGQHDSASTDIRDEYYSTKHGKMAASYYGFLDNYLLNPKTGVPGHMPPGIRRQFHPPPTFPGLMSPTLAADMQTSRIGRSEGRHQSRASAGMPQQARTPHFPPAVVHASPMPSILLDPHHQPSSSGFGARSGQRNSRSRYRAGQDIVEEATEEESQNWAGGAGPPSLEHKDSYESEPGLDESRWETSPTRGVAKQAEDEDEAGGADVGGGGVLGLLYQFQKAQTDGRAGINI